MARRNYIQELEYQNAQGMDTTSSLPNIMPGFVQEAFNANITDDGTYEKRDGYRIRCHESSDWDNLAYNIRNGIRFKPLVGGARTILYGEGVSGGAVGLAVRPSDPGSTVNILEPASGLQFTETFVDDTGFTYNSNLAEFVTSPTTQVQQKLSPQIPAGVTFHSNFEDNTLDADFSTGSPTATVGGAILPSIQTKNGSQQIYLPGASGANFAYPAQGNINPDVFGIKFWFTPAYTGGLGAGGVNLTSSPNGPNGFRLRQGDTFTTNMTYHYNNTGGSGIVSFGTYSFTQDQEVYIELYVDNPAGLVWLWIGEEGGPMTLIGGAPQVISNGTRAAYTPTDIIQTAGNGNNNMGWFDDITFVNGLVTTPHNAPSRASTELPSYVESKVDLPTLAYSGVGDIQSFDSFTATEVGSPRYIIEGTYWNGTIWATSDGSYAQANTAADVNANINLITPPGTDTLDVSIVFPDGSTQAAVSEIQVGYTGETPVDSEALDCIETIKGGLTTLRAYFVTSRGLLFVYNGEEPFLYDGTATRQIGIDRPNGAVTGVAASGGSLNASSSYVVAVTHYNPTTGAESSPVVSEPIELGLTENQIDLTFPAGDTATASVTRIYRSVANGNTLFLDSEISVTDTTFSITRADRDLETLQLELDNSRITDFTSTPNYPALINNRVFVKSGFNEIRFSKVGQSGAMPESFEVKSLATTEGSHGANDDIVGIGKINTLPIVIKERSIGRLAEAGVPDTGISSDLVTYIYQEISNVVGGVGHAAGCQVFDEYVFLGRDDVYATNGVNVRSIGEKISDTIKQFNFKDGNAEKLSAINDTKNKRVYISAISGATNEPDWVLVGDYRQYPKFRWTIYRPAQTGFCQNGMPTGPDSHPGIQAGCFWEELNEDDGTPDIFFGNLRANSQYYRMNVGEADEAERDESDEPIESGIWFRITSRAYSFNEPLIEKLFKDTEFFAVAKDKSYELQVASMYDLSNYAEGGVGFPLPTVGSIWSDNTLTVGENAPNGEWADNTTPGSNDAIWAGETLTRLNYDPHRKARFYQVRFSQIEAHAPITLYGWGVQASFMRPR